MFRVILAGGVALTATLPALAAGCGGSVGTLTDAGDAGGHGDAFPQEGPAPQPDGFPSEGFVAPDAFPQETAQLVDAFPQEGPDVGVAVDAGLDVFPQEGPNADAGFPSETAAP
jgi:hypothetical protein